MKKIVMYLIVILLLLFGFFYKGNNTNLQTFYLKNKDFNKVDINIPSSQVNIYSTSKEDYKVEIQETNNSLKNHSIYLDENNGTIKIRQYEKKRRIKIDSFVRQNIINVYIPDQYVKPDIKISGDKAKINISNVNLNKINIKTRDSILSINDINFNTIKYSSYISQIKLNRIIGLKMNIKINKGSGVINNSNILNSIFDVKRKGYLKYYNNKGDSMDVIGNQIHIYLKNQDQIDKLYNIKNPPKKYIVKNEKTNALEFNVNNNIITIEK